MNPQNSADKLVIKLICDLIRLNCLPAKRRPIKHSFEECVEKILIVLKTGQQWSTLGDGYSTYHKRFCEWSDNNIFEDAFYILQKIPAFCNKMGTSFYIDACVLRNKCGRDQISYCKKIPKKRSVKITIIIGSNGLPVSLVVSKSSVHDVKFVMPALAKIQLRKRKVKTLIGDKGYQQTEYRRELKTKGINYLHDQKRNLKNPFVMNPKEQLLCDKRYMVEGAFSTILANRRLNVRYEQHMKHFESFIYLAMIKMIFKKLGPL